MRMITDLLNSKESEGQSSKNKKGRKKSKNQHEILDENSSDGDNSKIGIGPPKYSDEGKSCEGEDKTSAES